MTSLAHVGVAKGSRIWVENVTVPHVAYMYGVPTKPNSGQGAASHLDVTALCPKSGIGGGLPDTVI